MNKHWIKKVSPPRIKAGNASPGPISKEKWWKDVEKRGCHGGGGGRARHGGYEEGEHRGGGKRRWAVVVWNISMQNEGDTMNNGCHNGDDERNDFWDFGNRNGNEKKHSLLVWTRTGMRNCIPNIWEWEHKLPSRLLGTGMLRWFVSSKFYRIYTKLSIVKFLGVCIWQYRIGWIESTLWNILRTGREPVHRPCLTPKTARQCCTLYTIIWTKIPNTFIHKDIRPHINVEVQGPNNVKTFSRIHWWTNNWRQRAWFQSFAFC